LQSHAVGGFAERLYFPFLAFAAGNVGLARSSQPVAARASRACSILSLEEQEYSRNSDQGAEDRSWRGPLFEYKERERDNKDRAC